MLSSRRHLCCFLSVFKPRIKINMPTRYMVTSLVVLITSETFRQNLRNNSNITHEATIPYLAVKRYDEISARNTPGTGNNMLRTMAFFLPTSESINNEYHFNISMLRSLPQQTIKTSELVIAASGNNSANVTFIALYNRTRINVNCCTSEGHTADVTFAVNALERHQYNGSLVFVIAAIGVRPPHFNVTLIVTELKPPTTINRRKRSTTTAMPTSTPPPASQPNPICHVQSWTVDFHHVGFSSVIEPRTIMANKCAGICPTPANSYPEIDYSDYAYLKSNFHIVTNFENTTTIPRACCVPTEFSTVVVLHLQDNNTLVSNLEVIVTRCGCR